jgi:hypothetical protein
MSKNAKRFTVAAVLATLAVASLIYNLSRSSGGSDIVPADRTSFDFLADWADETTGEVIVTEAAGIGPRTNPKTQADTLWPSYRFRCSDHGEFRGLVKFGADGRPLEYRLLPSGEWLPFREPDGTWNVRCPKCKTQLTSEQRRPIPHPEDELPPD